MKWSFLVYYNSSLKNYNSVRIDFKNKIPMRYLYQTKSKTMSTLVRILVLIIINSNVLSAQDDTGLSLTVHIENLDNNDGKLLVGLYNEESQFLNETYQGIVAEIEDKKSTVTFKGVPKGVYAVSFVHDENNNGKMDTNFMGIPKEDYGCSNNATGFMGPPKWKDAKFQLKDNSQTITISL